MSDDAPTIAPKPSVLLDTHPTVGLAQWEAWWQQDLTGDYPCQPFCEILDHEYTIGRCGICGARERRHVVVDRMLVGCNAGHVRRTASYDCTECGHGGLSNYRIPWRDW
jgi:hypothetical protein